MGLAGTQTRYCAFLDRSMARSSSSSSSPLTVSLARTRTRSAGAPGSPDAAATSAGPPRWSFFVAKYRTTTIAQEARLSTSWVRAVASNAIWISTARMPATTTAERAGKAHILTVSFSGAVRLRRMICETAISRYTKRITAPDEFSRNRNTWSGDTAAAITQRKPTTVEHRMAGIGTPARLTDIRTTGASRRAASTNSIRDAV